MEAVTRVERGTKKSLHLCHNSQHNSRVSYVRGLDKDERAVLDVVARRDVKAALWLCRDAVLRCVARNLFQMVVEQCSNCGDCHEVPMLTPEGKTAMACDDAMRTLEL
jgi:hypothetical protein